jgi:hypothetical protein
VPRLRREGFRGCAGSSLRIILFRSMLVDYVDGRALHRVARVQEVMDAAHQAAFEVDTRGYGAIPISCQPANSQATLE